MEKSFRSCSVLQEHLSALGTSFSQCRTLGKEEEEGLPGRSREAGHLCSDESPCRVLVSEDQHHRWGAVDALLPPAPRAGGNRRGVAEELYKHLKKLPVPVLRTGEQRSMALASA